jgi:hypothetical protein
LPSILKRRRRTEPAEEGSDPAALQAGQFPDACTVIEFSVVQLCHLVGPGVAILEKDKKK